MDTKKILSTLIRSKLRKHLAPLRGFDLEFSSNLLDQMHDNYLKECWLPQAKGEFLKLPQEDQERVLTESMLQAVRYFQESREDYGENFEAEVKKFTETFSYRDYLL